MSRHWIKIEGFDIEIATKNNAPIRGFFVTRLVDADSAEAAQASALASVAQDWVSGRYAALQQIPTLEVAETGEAGLLSRFTINTAYIFHRGR